MEQQNFNNQNNSPEHPPIGNADNNKVSKISYLANLAVTALGVSFLADSLIDIMPDKPSPASYLIGIALTAGGLLGLTNLEKERKSNSKKQPIKNDNQV